MVASAVLALLLASALAGAAAGGDIVHQYDQAPKIWHRRARLAPPALVPSPLSLPRRDVPSQPNPPLRRTSSSPSSPSPPPSSLQPPLPAVPPPPLALAPPPPLALAPSRPALSVLSRRSAARRRSCFVSPGGAEVAAPASARPRLPALLAAAAAPCHLEERFARPRLPVHGVAMDAGFVPATRMQRYGPNELERHAPPSVWMLGHGGAHEKRTTPPQLGSSPSWSPPPPTSKKLQGNLPRARRIGSEMWESLALTLAGVAGNSIGKVLQKKGTLILPPLSFKLKVIRGCALNMLSQAPVRLPPGHVRRRPHAHHALTGLCCAAGCGLATLCIFSNFYLKEVMNGLDWIAITMAGLGTIGELRSLLGNGDRMEIELKENSVGLINGSRLIYTEFYSVFCKFRSLCQRGGAESGRDSLFQYTLAGAHRCHLFCRFCSTFGFISTKSKGANNVGLQSGYISDGGRVWGG